MALRAFAFILVGVLLGGCMHGTIEAASDANLTPRDRKLLANAPYAKANIPAAYQRTIVSYHRKEAPGTIVIDSDARYLYYVLADNKAMQAVFAHSGWPMQTRRGGDAVHVTLALPAPH